MKKTNFGFVAIALLATTASHSAFADCSRFADDPQKQYYCEQNERNHAGDAAAAAAGAVVVGAVGADLALQGAGEEEHGVGPKGATAFDRFLSRLYQAGKSVNRSVYKLVDPRSVTSQTQAKKVDVAVSTGSSASASSAGAMASSAK